MASLSKIYPNIKQIKNKIYKIEKLLFTVIAIFGLATITFGQTIPSYVPSNGLVGWWPFNGNANDESGFGNNGTLVNTGSTFTTLIADRFGYNNCAYRFRTGYITCGRPSFADFQTSSFTISVWFKTNQNNGILNDYSFIYYGLYATANSQWGIRNYVNGVINASIYSNGENVQSTNSFTDNLWHNAIFVRNTATLSVYLYIDGQIVNTNSFPFASNIVGSNQAQLYFGGLPWAATGADIDDIGIWNRALSQQEITSIYTTCTGTGVITADGPTTFCAGNSVNLKSDVAGGTYQWKRNGLNIATNSTSRTFKATLTGSYTCVATCNGTALTSNAIPITSKTNAAVTLNATGATSFCAGDSVTLNATNLGSNYSIQWYRSNISIDNATGYTQVIKQPGTYKVVTKNLTTGCSRISGSAITTIINCRIANSTDNNDNGSSDNLLTEKITGNDVSDGVSIYPNPSNGAFVLEYEGEQSGSGFMQLVNSIGQTIYESNVEVADGLFSKEVKLDDKISQGIYIVRLFINGSVNDSRIIVK